MSPAHQQTPFQQCPAHQRAPSQQYREHQHTRASLTPSRARTSSIPVLPLSSLKPQRAPAHASPPQAVTRTSTSQPPPRPHQFYPFSPLIHNAHQRITFLCSARPHHKHRSFNYTLFAMTHALY